MCGSISRCQGLATPSPPETEKQELHTGRNAAHSQKPTAHKAYGPIHGDLRGAYKTKTSELSQWGQQDSDLIEIWREGQAVESISARIDARELNVPFVKRLLLIAENWNCRLVYSRYRTILPQDYTEFIQALNDSPNFQVIGNPKEWLPRMANEVAQNERDTGTSFKIDD
jgi:hypothetical protein